MAEQEPPEPQTLEEFVRIEVFGRKEYVREHLKEAEEGQRRHKEECRRVLNDPERLEHVETIVKQLGKLPSEAIDKQHLLAMRPSYGPEEVDALRKAERARTLGQMWLTLAVYVAAMKGRASRWPAALRRALARVDDVQAVLAKHPTLRGLDRLEPVDDLMRAKQRLVELFPISQPKKRGRPIASQHHECVAHLRELGLAERQAEELARAVGLVADHKEKAAPEVKPPRKRVD